MTITCQLLLVVFSYDDEMIMELKKLGDDFPCIQYMSANLFIIILITYNRSKINKKIKIKV